MFDILFTDTWNCRPKHLWLLCYSLNQGEKHFLTKFHNFHNTVQIKNKLNKKSFLFNVSILHCYMKKNKMPLSFSRPTSCWPPKLICGDSSVFRLWSFISLWTTQQYKLVSHIFHHRTRHRFPVSLRCIVIFFFLKHL